MKSFLAFVFSIFLFSTAHAGLKEKALCASEAAQTLAVLIADTLPFTAAVVDSFVDGGFAQKGDSTFESFAEFSGGAAMVAADIAVLTTLASLGAQSIPGDLAVGMVAAVGIPYRSTAKQFQYLEKKCN